jgi:hypothetical protein
VAVGRSAIVNENQSAACGGMDLSSMGYDSHGLAALDDYLAPVLCVLGNLTMRTTAFHIVQTQPNSTYVNFRATVKEIDVSEVRRKPNIFLEWALGHNDVQKVFDTLNARISSLNCFLCVGTLVDPDTDECNILAYIRKQGTNALPDLTIDGHAPSCYYPEHPTGRMQQKAVNAITAFASLIGTAAGNIVVEKPAKKDMPSFHQVLHAAQSLSKLDLAMVKGQIKAKSKDDLSEFDKQFMRVLPVIMEIRQINDAATGSMLFNAYDPPFKICPLDKFINMSQVGTRLKEVVMTEETYLLKDLFRRSSLLQNYAIILLGASTTTGFGKTQFTMRLAVEWAKAYCEHNCTPKDTAMVFLSSTIDPAKSVSFKPGMVWILDEFSPSDSQQLVHMSETMLKVLLTPQMGGTLRGRNEDVKMVPGVARLISANSASPQAWCGTNSDWSEPLRRKSICYNIGQPLCSDAWRAQAASETANENAGFDEVLNRNTSDLE